MPNLIDNIKDCTTKISYIQAEVVEVAGQWLLVIIEVDIVGRGGRKGLKLQQPHGEGDPALNLERKAGRFWPCGMGGSLSILFSSGNFHHLKGLA